MLDPVRRLLSVCSILILALAPLACTPSDPAARVAAARSDYKAQLSGWIIRAEEPEEVVSIDDGEADLEGEDDGEVAAPDADMDADMAMDTAPIEVDPRSQSVLFDVIVLYSGSRPLPGITVDISHRDASGVEKVVRRHYLEVPRVRRGATEQVDFELDGWDLADGDSFSVEVRQGVPEAERGEYREFQEAGG